MATLVAENLKHETLQILRSYQLSPSPKLRNQLVELNLGLVRKEAHHWVNQCQESYEDLMQVGSIGLIRAIERFDISKGCAFSSFALPYVRGEIQHYLRDKSTTVRIPRRWQTLRQQSVQVTRQFQATHRRLPNDIEIAQALEITTEEWQEIKLAHLNREPISLDTPIGDGDEDSHCLGELVPDQNYKSFQLAQEDRLRLQQALVQLENRTREILEFVFLQDLTQKEVADRLNISVVTVSRRVKKGLDSLKESMAGSDNCY
jgi:RNA polymerase sigma-B factor